MSYGAALADPAADIRDVVETFRIYGVLTSDWREALAKSIRALEELSPDVQSACGVPLLVHRLHVLLEAGLEPLSPVLDAVAEHAASLLAQSQVPGIPRPSDDNWEFD
jgi:hypothetical protein